MIKISKNMQTCEVILGIILLFCTIFRIYNITLHISAISLIVYTIILIFSFKDKLLFKYLWSFIATIFLLIGIFACDFSNIWLAEIDCTTYYCGSFNIIALYFWIYYFILRKIDPYFEKSTKRKMTNIKMGTISLSDNLIKYGKLIVFVVGGGLFLSVAMHPFFLYGVTNRFEYSQTYITRWQNLLRVFPPILAPLVIIPVLNSEKLNFSKILKNIIIPYLPHLLFLIWTGNKYGAYVELLVLILVPFISLNRIKIRICLVFKYGITILVAILAFLFLYYHLQGLNLADTIYEIYLRVACQGELWWKTVMTVQVHGTNINEFSKELLYQLQAIVTEASVKKYGVYHLMNLFGRMSIVEQYGSIGTRYAASGMELFFYCFGFGALLLPLLICPITAWINNMYINAIKEGRVFTAIVAARMIMLLNPALSQGDWYAFFSVVPFIFVCMLVFIEIWNLVKK